MKGLESGKEKIKKICEELKRETLEPAQMEAEKIVEAARFLADEIVAKAHHQIKEMHEKAHREIEQQKAIFQASLSHACRQTLEALKEKIEHKLFNPEIARLLETPLQEAKVVAKLIEAAVQAIEKEGIEADLSVAISSATPAREVNELLAAKILQKLKEKSVLLSSIGGGIEVKLVGQNMTIALSDTTFTELVADYVREDFRRFVLSAHQ